MLAISALSRLKSAAWRPRNWVPSFKAARILWKDYGHFQSVVSRAPVDAACNPLPWYTYPAIEFLAQLDFSDKCVFEYGAGMSTLFWARVAGRVVSVEDEKQWCESLTPKLPPNATLVHEADLSRYADVIRSHGAFDIIVVDGPARGRTRLKCCRAALTALRAGGLVILDNSDWLPESSTVLRDSGLLEVDFTGFAPICDHVQTTSLYFHRAFNVPPLTGRQPMPGHGAKLDIWERPLVPVPGPLITCDGEPFRGVVDDVTFEFSSRGGRRKFRGVNYLGADGIRCIAILDLDLDRVLLTRHRPPCRRQTEPDLSREIARIAAMSWDAFRQFIGRHAYRRYVL
jgi:hypothetical protein